MKGIVYDEMGNAIFNDGNPETPDTVADTSQPTWTSGYDVPSQEARTANGFYETIVEKARALDAQVVKLADIQQKFDAIKPAIVDNAALLADWQSQYDKISTAQSVIDNASSVIAQVQTWWNDVGGAVKSALGLGFVIAIPWAAIGVISAAILSIAALVQSCTYSYSKYRQYELQKINIDRANQGLPPIVDTVSPGGGFLDGLGKNLGLVLGLAAVYFLFVKGQ